MITAHEARTLSQANDKTQEKIKHATENFRRDCKAAVSNAVLEGQYSTGFSYDGYTDVNKVDSELKSLGYDVHFSTSIRSYVVISWRPKHEPGNNPG